MKLLVKLVFALIVLVVVACLALVFYIDHLAKAGIERGATYALGVETSVADADVGIFSGEFALTGLDVANPDGFPADHFMRLDAGNVAVSLRSLRQETVELPALGLRGLDMVLERQGGKANYDVILEKLKRLETGAGGKPPDAAGAKRYVIRDLTVRDVMVHLNLVPAAGELTKLSVPIDEIRLRDVGAEGGRGVVLGELASVLIKAVLAAVVEKGGALPVDFRAALEAGLARLKPLEEMGIESVFDVQGRTQEIAEDLEKVKGDLEETIKGLGGLLGGEKKK